MMVRNQVHIGCPRAGARVLCAAFYVSVYVSGALGFSALVHAQTGNPSSATNPFYGSVTLHPATDEVLQLSLDDAVRRGLDTNLGLREAEAGEKQVLGQKNQALQEFLPTINLSGGTGVFQHNLAALGFNAGVIDSFKGVFPGGVRFPQGSRRSPGMI